MKAGTKDREREDRPSMAKHHRAVEDKQNQKRRRRVKPVVAELASDRAGLPGLTELPGGLINTVDGDTIQAQAARLGDERLQSAQRQALAAQIGQTQGNRHVQRLAGTLQQSHQTKLTSGESDDEFEKVMDRDTGLHATPVVQRNEVARKQKRLRHQIRRLYLLLFYLNGTGKLSVDNPVETTKATFRQRNGLTTVLLLQQHGAQLTKPQLAAVVDLMSTEPSVGSPEGSMWYRAQYLRALLRFQGFYLEAPSGDQKQMMKRMAQQNAKRPKRTKDPTKLRQRARNIVRSFLPSIRHPFVREYWKRIQEAYNRKLAPLVRSADQGWGIRLGYEYSLAKQRKRLEAAAKPSSKLSYHSTAKAILDNVKKVYPSRIRGLIKGVFWQCNEIYGNRGVKKPAMVRLEFDYSSVEQGKALKKYLPKFALFSHFRIAPATVQWQLLKILVDHPSSAGSVYRDRRGVLRALVKAQEKAELKGQWYKIMSPLLQRMVRDALAKQPGLAYIVRDILKEYETANIRGGIPRPNKTVFKALAILILDKRPERHFKPGAYYGISGPLGRIGVGQEYKKLLRDYLTDTKNLRYAQALGV